MKWPQGQAVITRSEHWEQAAQHLWGLSRAELVAYISSPPLGLLHPTNEFRKARSIDIEEPRAVLAKAAAR